MADHPIPFPARAGSIQERRIRDPYPHTSAALEHYDRHRVLCADAAAHDTRPGAGRRAEHRDALARFEVREAFCRDTRTRPDRRTRREIAGMSIDEIRALVTRDQEG